jgi:general secretion pathway protein J
MIPARPEADCLVLRLRKSNRAGGFTLVEVVVALAVLSLLMIAVVAALRTFGNTQGSLDKLAGRIDEIRSVSSFLREGLEATVIGGSDAGGLSFGGSAGAGGSERELSFFKGDAGGFQWKARMVFGEAYGGTFLLRVVRTDDTLLLQWQVPPAPIESATWEDQLSRVLADRLQEFHVSYRGKQGTDWQEQWDEVESPELVRLNIRAGDRYWPELIMAVQR